MKLGDIKYKILLNLKNIPGPRVKKKIVVFECDDYGGIRMPSVEVCQKMKAKGVSVSPSRYNIYDTLENEEDLSLLFETLSSVKDMIGNNAVITPFVNVANPDFDKIKASRFEEYFYEPFTSTLQKYGRSNEILKLWQQGMEACLFVPEFHGREHVSVQPWMKMIREGNKQLRTAADYGFVSVADVEGIHEYAQEFRPEFYFTEESQKGFLHKSIVQGVNLFEQLFGYTPGAFMPANSVFHPDFEETVFKTGIKFLVVAHKNLTPGNKGNPTYTNFTFRQGIKNEKLNYYIRNCAFEPSDEAYSSVSTTLKQIEAAFRWNRPAIISTHRVNFCGGLNKENRRKGLQELKLLLNEILKRWPDAEFMSTAAMLKELKN